MLLFLTGMGTGAALCFAAIVWIANRSNKRARAAQTAQPDYRALLGEARRYLGQIASRQSINEARKIANKALKQTETGK
jgi:gas vesicle protein